MAGTESQQAEAIIKQWVHEQTLLDPDWKEASRQDITRARSSISRLVRLTWDTLLKQHKAKEGVNSKIKAINMYDTAILELDSTDRVFQFLQIVGRMTKWENLRGGVLEIACQGVATIYNHRCERGGVDEGDIKIWRTSSTTPAKYEIKSGRQNSMNKANKSAVHRGIGTGHGGGILYLADTDITTYRTKKGITEWGIDSWGQISNGKFSYVDILKVLSENPVGLDRVTITDEETRRLIERHLHSGAVFCEY